MPNQIGLAGGQPQKQTRFAPIYTGRWSSGIWTNRSPLRDANTTRLVEKFYGPAGDALIAGLNTEITNRLTLARRPGNSLFDGNDWGTIDRFYDFRLFSSKAEQIKIMVDNATVLASLYNGVRTVIFTKSTGAGSTYMQSVGNTLYFADGVDNKKWIQTLAAWSAGFNWATPSTPVLTTFIIDTNNNIQQLLVQGVSSGTQPVWNSVTPNAGNDFQGGQTADGGAIWINRGSYVENWGISSAPLSPLSPTVSSSPGSLTTTNGGWQYTIALVNTIDNTVSNAAQLSPSTGNFTNVAGVTFAPGDGINPALVDTQADYVAIFRTTDGESTPFLIPDLSVLNLPVTLSLWQYLTSGYTDTTPDTGLNNLIQAPLAGQNTPPAVGAINLSFHLNRIFYSIGNIVYWTSGPDTPVGNGVNGTAPLNYDSYPSLVKRLVPTTSGLFVFTVSDVYLIQGAGTASNPIQAGIPILQGLGLSSYNALDVNGSVIGFFSTDNQFIIIDPSAGVSYAGFPIGDQLRLNNGKAGQSWNPANVYVAWHVEGEDAAWYLADGDNGWYRLMTTPSPETGYTWSPFADLKGGQDVKTISAVSSIEVSPGIHRLLIGQENLILFRDLNSFTDAGTAYIANAVIGSAVLAQPGQLAAVSFVTTDSVFNGTPMTLGIVLDEALPYYTGRFEVLTNYIADPPEQYISTSIRSQRFYLADLNQAATCRHLQLQLNWIPENVQNELLSLTIFGAFYQEQ